MPRPFLTTQWRNLVMLNYEVDPAVLARLVPDGVELDDWQGRHFVSVVGFQFLDTRLWGVAVPWHRAFPEVNLRFYVRRELPSECRRGVVFVREAVPRRAVAAVARWFYNEKFVRRPVRHLVRLPDERTTAAGRAAYGWQSRRDRLRLEAAFVGRPRLPGAGSQEEFIMEHYWGYTRQRNGTTLEYRVDHPAWKLWETTRCALDADVALLYGPQLAAALTSEPASGFVVEGSALTVYAGTGVGQTFVSVGNRPTAGKNKNACPLADKDAVSAADRNVCPTAQGPSA